MFLYFLKRGWFSRFFPFIIYWDKDKISSWYLICVYQVKWSISGLSDPKYTIIGTWFITETLIIGCHCDITVKLSSSPSRQSRDGQPVSDWSWPMGIADPPPGWDPPEIQTWSGVMTNQLVFFHSQPAAHSITQHSRATSSQGWLTAPCQNVNTTVWTPLTTSHRH